MLFFRKIENVKFHTFSSARGVYYYSGPECGACGAKATDRDIYGAPTFVFNRGKGDYVVVKKCGPCIPATDFMEGRDAEPMGPQRDPAEDRAAEIAVRKAMRGKQKGGRMPA